MQQRRHPRIPGYADARPIPRVDATELEGDRFLREHVGASQPCLVVDAIADWPAARHWTSPEYLLRKIGAHVEIEANLSPRGEHHNARAATKERLTFGELVARATAAECEHLVLFAYPLSSSALADHEAQLRRHPLRAVRAGHSVLEPLFDDVTGFSFLNGARAARHYASYRAFLFRNGYTDWHYHPTDESLMCQIGAAKEVLLAPPDQETWDELVPLLSAYGGVFDHEAEVDLPGRLYRVVVQPGDALYIPPFWWHSVEPVDDRMGVTVAASFASPLASMGELRYPAARNMLRGMGLAGAPLAAAAIASSLLKRLRG